MALSAALLCLALNVYHEARGEPLDGQIAVAYVTHKRAGGDQKRYCQEVYRKGQFSWTADRARLKVDKASPQWRNAVAVAQTFMHFSDPTKGATHYHAKRVRPEWRKSMMLLARIGQHVFYKEA